MKVSPPTLEDVKAARKNISGIAEKTILEKNNRLSEAFDAEIYLKREDLQVTRAYKVRGAYNLMSLLGKQDKQRGICCASAGNHAKGVAFACKKLKIVGYIFMPQNSPRQKIDGVKKTGGSFIKVILSGDTFDDAKKAALTFSKKKNIKFIHPFDDANIIAGQGTIADEIFEEMTPDIIIVPVGGGGLLSGIAIYVNEAFPKTKLFGVEPEGAASMKRSLDSDSILELDEIDTFVDGAAVKKVGSLTYKICSKNIKNVVLVPEGKICSDMIDLYQNEGIIAEPAGTLAISAIESIKAEVKGKKVVCILSGGNNDIARYADILERSLIYRGLKHYFIVEFAQKPGTLREYLDNALGINDDIVRFEYIKKSNKEFGPALVGVELSRKEDFKPLLSRMDKLKINYKIVEPNSFVFQLLI